MTECLFCDSEGTWIFIWAALSDGIVHDAVLCERCTGPTIAWARDARIIWLAEGPCSDVRLG